MAERTGIPKRTLDKYMLRSNAILPGYDALISLSKGLGVSLDWLVFGAENFSQSSKLLASKAATQIAQDVFGAILRHLQEEGSVSSKSESLCGLTPEMWAVDLGQRIGTAAEELAAAGVTLEELLLWEQRNYERAGEFLKGLADRFIETEKQ